MSQQSDDMHMSHQLDDMHSCHTLVVHGGSKGGLMQHLQDTAGQCHIVQLAHCCVSPLL